jgi:hypothetical protein
MSRHSRSNGAPDRRLESDRSIVSRRDLIVRAGQVAGGTALAAVGARQLGRDLDPVAHAAGMEGAGGHQTSRSLSAMQVEPGEYVQAVVSSHELATQAGLEMLAQGGTAADAAIAVAGVLSVVEPWFSNVLGGGTWALYFDAETGEVTSLDGVGPNPSNVTREDYAPRAGTAGIHNANVPGAWDGWMLWLDRYGRLDLGQILEPAIMAAREGHPVSPTMAFWLDTQADIILEMPDTAQVYAPEGVFPEQGEIFTQPQIADTFEAIAGAYEDALGESRAAAVQAARDYVYRGPIAEAIVAFSDANDGYFVLDDFGTFEAAIVDAISIDYRDDLTVFQNPPNSQGITMLIALNILKGFDFSQFSPDDPNAVHLQIEYHDVPYPRPVRQRRGGDDESRRAVPRGGRYGHPHQRATAVPLIGRGERQRAGARVQGAAHIESLHGAARKSALYPGRKYRNRYPAARTAPAVHQRRRVWHDRSGSGRPAAIRQHLVSGQ